MKDEFKVSIVFLAVLFFFMGFVLTDYGATLRLAGGHGESLMLAEIPPRIVYHLGLVSEVVGFFLLYTVSVSYFVNMSSQESQNVSPQPSHART